MTTAAAYLMMKNDEFKTAKRLKQLRGMVGKDTTYGALMNLLWLISRPERFTPDPLCPDTLVWRGNATVAVDQPVASLSLDNHVRVTKVVLGDVGAPEWAENLEEATSPPKEVTTRGHVNPIPFIVAMLAEQRVPVREAAKEWRRDPARFQRGARKSGLLNDDYLMAMGAEHTQAVRQLLGLLGDLDVDECTARLRRWLAPYVELFEQANGDLNEFMRIADTGTRLKTWGALGAFMEIGQGGAGVLDCAQLDEDTVTCLNDMAAAQQRMFALTAPPASRIRGLGPDMYDVVVKAIAGQTLWRSSTCRGMYDTVADLLRSEHLSIDLLDEQEFGEQAAATVLRAAAHLRVQRETDVENLVSTGSAASDHTGLLFTLKAIKLLAAAYRRERGLALRYLESRHAAASAAVDSGEVAKQRNRAAELERLLAERQARLNDMQQELDRTALRAAQLETENAQLREFMDALERAEADEEAEVLEDGAVEVSTERLPEGTVLVGGHPRWQKFFKQAHPDVTVVDGTAKSLNEKMFTNQTPLVLINPTHMSHAVFYKLMPVLKRRRISYVYRHRIHVQG